MIKQKQNGRLFPSTNTPHLFFGTSFQHVDRNLSPSLSMKTNSILSLLKYESLDVGTGKSHNSLGILVKVTLFADVV